jgi:hypothetical protein
MLPPILTFPHKGGREQKYNTPLCPEKIWVKMSPWWEGIKGSGDRIALEIHYSPPTPTLPHPGGGRFLVKLGVYVIAHIILRRLIRALIGC